MFVYRTTLLNADQKNYVLNNYIIVFKIVTFLCSDSGSHDYTINRTEAKNLGLRVESPNQDTYNELKAWYFDVVSELELKNEYSPQKVLGINPNVQYSFKRCRYSFN